MSYEVEKENEAHRKKKKAIALDGGASIEEEFPSRMRMTKMNME